MQTPPLMPLPPDGLAPDELWWVEPENGIRIRAAIWRAVDPVGHVIFFTGRTEFLEKVANPAAEFVARGYSVISWDWRGQGLSSRQADPGLKGHVDNFDEFQRDVDAVLASPQVEGLAGKRLLVGHSMGGCIATHTLARPELASTIDASVLCAPMLGIRLSPAMRVVAWMTVKIAMALGRGKCWPPFGDVKTPYVLTEPDDNVLTSDEAMFDWMVRIAKAHPESSIAMPTLGWLYAATKAIRKTARSGAPDLPILCLLGSKEEVVDDKAVRAGAERMHARLALIKDGKHELFIEREDLRALAWQAIDSFLEGNDLPTRKDA